VRVGGGGEVWAGLVAVEGKIYHAGLDAPMAQGCILQAPNPNPQPPTPNPQPQPQPQTPNPKPKQHQPLTTCSTGATTPSKNGLKLLLSTRVDSTVSCSSIGALAPAPPSPAPPAVSAPHPWRSSARLAVTTVPRSPGNTNSSTSDTKLPG